MNELRAILEDTVTRLFTDMVTQPLLERAETGEWPADLWDAIDECGLTRPHLPEAAGGADGTWGDAYVILRACGRHCVPVPLGETILASWLLHAAEIEIPDGPLSIVPEVVDASVYAVDRGPWTARRVPWGRTATHLVLAVERPDGIGIGLTSTEHATVTPGENLAREPRDDVELPLPPTTLKEVALPPNAIQVYGAMIRSAQMAGALDMLLAQSVQYAGEREQFGRPIAKFQAIQQDLAKLAGYAAAAGTAAAAAFRAAERAADTPDGPDPTFEVAVAKTLVGEAAERGPTIAHQVHGAIGFTYEHVLHFATRRLWAWRTEFGGEAYWAALLGREAMARGADELWPYVTSR